MNKNKKANVSWEMVFWWIIAAVAIILLAFGILKAWGVGLNFTSIFGSVG